MSWSPAQASSFAQQGARLRQSVMAGRTDAQGNNIEIAGRRFRVPFSLLSTIVELRHHGKMLRCTALILMCQDDTLVIDETTIVKHIPTGDIYEVAQVGVEHPVSKEKRVLLHKQYA